MTCDELAVEHRSVIERYNLLASRQRKAAAGDAIGVFVIGIPTASLLGEDKEADIALLKGQDDAIRNAKQAKDCPTPFQ